MGGQTGSMHGVHTVYLSHDMLADCLWVSLNLYQPFCWHKSEDSAFPSLPTQLSPMSPSLLWHNPVSAMVDIHHCCCHVAEAAKVLAAVPSSYCYRAFMPDVKDPWDWAVNSINDLHILNKYLYAHLCAAQFFLPVRNCKKVL